MEEESNDSETNQALDSSHEISERSQRFKRRLDYAEYSNDEEDDKAPGTSKRGKKERKAKPVNMGPQKKNRTRFSEEEVADMWLFIIERLRHPITQKVLKLRSGAQIWKEFKKENNSPRNELSFYVHFRRSMIPSLDMTNFDMQTKTILHYALEIPCTTEFIRELREDEKVEVLVNENDLITAYRKIKCGRFHEDDGWDEVWGDDVLEKGKTAGPSSVAGSSGGRTSRQNVAMDPPYEDEMWPTGEAAHMENFEGGDEMVGNEVDEEDFMEKPKRKPQKKREMKKQQQPKPRQIGERKARKEKLMLLEKKKQLQDQQRLAGLMGPSSSMDPMEEDPANDFDMLHQPGSTSNLLQLGQSWASVYTPLVDSFERDVHSPEMNQLRM